MMIVAGTAALRILGNKEKEERNEKQTIPRVVNYIERGNSYRMLSMSSIKTTTTTMHNAGSCRLYSYIFNQYYYLIYKTHTSGLAFKLLCE